MSSFIVGDKTINRIIGWLNHHNNRQDLLLVLDAAQINPSDREFAIKLGISMAQLNADAVNCRYSETTNIAEFEYHGEIVSSIQALKSLQCWLYQCAEGDIPETSKLFQAFEQVKGNMACDIVRLMKAYDDAEWG